MAFIAEGNVLDGLPTPFGRNTVFIAESNVSTGLQPHLYRFRGYVHGDSGSRSTMISDGYAMILASHSSNYPPTLFPFQPDHRAGPGIVYDRLGS